MRPAQKAECDLIAKLYEMSSGGVANYIWSTLQDQFPGMSLLDVGQRRYERENTEFSYQNCMMAEDRGEVLGMLHSYPVEPRSDPIQADDSVDPVLRPYMELEASGTLYISGLAIWPNFRGQGIGSRLLQAGRDRAKSLELSELSLLCFAGNRRARRLYERQGFVVVDWRPVVPHKLIEHTGDVLLMLAPV